MHLIGKSGEMSQICVLSGATGIQASVARGVSKANKHMGNEICTQHHPHLSDV